MLRETRNFMLGNVGTGSGYPVSIQSMCNTRTADIDATLGQISVLAAAGCDIIRVSADTQDDTKALQEICRNSPMPVIADIQFSGESAIGAIKSGCAGIRVNPGIIHDDVLLGTIARCAVEHDTVIRVGANAGSLKMHGLSGMLAAGMEYSDAVSDLLCDAVLKQCEALEKHGVFKIKAAIKCSDIAVTLKSYRKFAALTDYPLHLGLTEAGTLSRGVLRSAIAVGALLTEGIGNTVRISLTADPVAEIDAAKKILDACGMGKNSVEIISCPTCGRTEIDLIGLAGKVEKLIAALQEKGSEIQWKKIAVMGCPVNGPGEARHADIGLAGSRSGQLIIFRKGETVGAYSEAEAFDIFAKMLISGC